MTGRRQLRGDERGVSTIVNHILAIGIISILIVGLLIAGGSYIQDQQQYAGQNGIETVGNELARDITQLVRLSGGGGQATVTSELPKKIAGHSYDVNVSDGSSCDRLPNTHKSCLVLEVHGLDIIRNVPLSVDETHLDMTRLDAGRYRFEYTGPTTGDAGSGAGVTDPSLRVGIGRDVAQRQEGGAIIGVTNLPPTNVSFEMEPEWPDSSRTIEFTADAVDPDPEDPTNPGMNYSWDFDGDGNYEIENKSSNVATHTYASHGLKNVTLRVTDEKNASTWDSKNISVAGLQYVGGSVQTTSSAFPGSEDVSFKMENTHASEIYIVGLYFRPVDGANRIRAWHSGTDYPEILFDSDDDGSWDDSYDFKGTWGSDGRDIPDSGLTVSAVYSSSSQTKINSTIHSGDTVNISLMGIQAITTPEYVIGVEYKTTEGSSVQTNVTQFDTRNVP